MTWYVIAETLRPVISFDYDDIASILMAAAALLAVLLTKKARTNTTSNVVTSEVDSDVLGKFSSVYERLTDLEKELALLKAEVEELEIGIRMLTAQIHELGAVPIWEWRRPRDG